jgi:hypothetical protein
MKTLFDEEVAEEEKRQQEHYERWVETHARPTHPATSMEAAEKMAPKMGPVTNWALEALRCLPGATASELESFHEVKDGRLRKRLSDLRAKGLARVVGKRKCRITGMNAQIWEATE